MKKPRPYGTGLSGMMKSRATLQRMLIPDILNIQITSQTAIAATTT
jgi:hypothetical protein